MTRIAVLDDYQGVALQMADWSTLPADCVVTVFNDHEADVAALASRLAGYEVVCIMRERTPFPRELFERLPDLKLLVTTGMRNASVDMAAAEEHGVTVCGTAGMEHPTPELTWGLLLALARHIPQEHAAMQRGGWQTTIGHGLKGRTLGIVGLGKLGRQVARYGQAFGMEVIAWSQNLTTEAAAEHGVTRVEKDDLFRRADAVSIHVVLSDRSRGLVGKHELGLMKPSAWIVNTSRGPIIDHDALVDALSHGRIGGAAVDVYDTEPLPRSSILRTLPNLIMTPHVGYVTSETYDVFYRETVENIRAWLAGAPVRVLKR